MNDLGRIDNSLLDSLGIQQPQKEHKDSLGQADFLQLLVAQLKNQNPMEPKDGAEFLGQMAQFGQLDGINKMSNSMDQLNNTFQSTQALQASSLVGRKVMIEANYGVLNTGQPIEGMVDLPSSVGNLQLTIQSAGGENIKQMDLGAQSAGQVPFKWTGIDGRGEGVQPGQYRIIADAMVGNEKQQFTTWVTADVNSVTMGQQPGGIQLNLTGFGSKAFSEVKALQ